ncbi:hypothetical protein NEMBOFW57_003629 [Staphylotrichum longicolle]|uniref:Uncharacterized protein n=1 Tax=Staphylotrichum longicolle TaxID=669026 RepID=A0AAD4F5B9_9PEZI|nr:hypothetical protein NEMBOFW57_003629 [Staphylotrichum longicolle]
MLFGSFSEGQDQQKGDDWTVTFPEDSPDSLRILLNAAHSKFDAIPTTLPNEAVFNLTVLSDKYDMVGLLKPFWSNWVGKLGVAPATPLGFVQRLWMAHTLGYLQCYKATLKELMSHLRVFNDKPGIFLQCYHEENLCENIHLQALGVLEDLEDGRLALLREAGAKLRDAIQTLTNRKDKGFLCRSEGDAEWKRICDCAMLGAVHRTLYGKTWYHSGEKGWEDRVTISVRHLVVKIQGVRAATVEESGMVKRKGGHHHKDCTPWADITLSGVLKGQKVDHLVLIDDEYFERQQAKSGVTELGTTPKFFGGGEFGMLDMYKD